MVDQSHRPLKLVRAFNRSDAKSQLGYQKVDETTVLERKCVPVAYDPRDGKPWTVYMVALFDFKQHLITYLCHDQYQQTVFPPADKNFSEVEGKEAILDAHRALVALGGTPPPIEDILGILNKPISQSPLFSRPGK